MPRQIARHEVQALLEQGAQVVDVLPVDEYETLHLPGAVSIPLKELTEKSVGGLRRDRPVIVYCFDFL
ncbi:MAG TPA: rhodanese-like domain-containing protein [Candidatus Dormibacteraeota bacterium]